MGWVAGIGWWWTNGGADDVLESCRSVARLRRSRASVAKGRVWFEVERFWGPSEVGGRPPEVGDAAEAGRVSVEREELAMVTRGGLRGGEGGSDTNKTNRIGCVVLIVLITKGYKYIKEREVGRG
jgi:hypothetical protein